MDKSIYEKQSDPLIIQCLFAQRKKYSQAKVVAGLYFFFCVVAACAFSVLKSIVHYELITGLSIGISFATFFAASSINNCIAKIRTEAAEIQQYIDTTLYSSNQYSHLNKKWSCPITKDRVIEFVSKYPQSGFTDNDKWYEDYSTYDYSKQILLCQKENLQWDNDLRKKYATTYKVIMRVIIASIFVAAVIINPSILNFLSIALWCLPFIKYLRSFNKQMEEDYNRITKLKNAADNLLNNFGLILDGDKLIQKEIELQNGIFEHRKQAVLIPNFFYKLCRSKQQKNEEKIAESYKGRH